MTPNTVKRPGGRCCTHSGCNECVPDWTYQPLRGIASAVLGERRSQRAALRVLATVVRVPGGRRLVVRAFGHRHPPVDVAERLGAVVPADVADDASRALLTIGAGFVETEPRPDGDRIYTSSADVAAAARVLADPAKTLVVTPRVLTTAGPGWFQRVTEAVTPTEPAPRLRDVPRDPRRWPAWWWGLLVGLGMVGAGVGAAAITLGPVLLWYDEDFLGMGRAELHAVNHHLVPFLQHDRVTMAGTMVAIGALYAGLAYGGMRQGWPWARVALLVSGLIGFPTLVYSLGTGFIEPLHTAVVVVLFPMFVAAVWSRDHRPKWTYRGEGSEAVWRRELVGQLLMVVTGVGLFVGGFVVSVVGLTTVFVRSDLVFLGVDVDTLRAVNARLLPFVTHDRAGFGGALMAAAAAITLLSAWGWRRGESWVWWTLLATACAGFLPAVLVHAVIGYTDFWHLAPVYFGMLLTSIALVLARPYLLARE